MRGISPGEGQRFFPSFFLLSFLLALVIGSCFFPPEAAAQQTKREGLSLFDRLAEEATLLNKRGQYDKVITLLEPHKGDKRNDSALFFNELGIAYRHKGRLSESIQAYQAAISREPENPVIMKNMADAFCLSKEYTQAIELYQKVLESNPRFQQAHAGLGLAYHQLEKYKEALEQFEIVLKLDPQDEQAKKFREVILKKLRRKK
ncbi:MAG: tetratricopeptide repeat protein [Deltaproteobacteria bacterium]|nr:tetratricopeptide repeat protein [Deltaproteobacteria bacterium]